MRTEKSAHPSAGYRLLFVGQVLVELAHQLVTVISVNHAGLLNGFTARRRATEAVHANVQKKLRRGTAVSYTHLDVYKRQV